MTAARARWKVLVLNQVSERGLQRLPADRYEVGKSVPEPDAILVRSADMHAMDIPASHRRGNAPTAYRERR